MKVKQDIIKNTSNRLMDDATFLSCLSLFLLDIYFFLFLKTHLWVKSWLATLVSLLSATRLLCWAFISNQVIFFLWCDTNGTEFLIYYQKSEVTSASSLECRWSPSWNWFIFWLSELYATSHATVIGLDHSKKIETDHVVVLIKIIIKAYCVYFCNKWNLNLTVRHLY